MIKSIGEMNDKMIQLIEITEPKNGEIIFTDESKAIVKEIADFARMTNFFKDNANKQEEFWKKWSDDEPKVKDPAFVLSFIMVKIAEAPGAVSATYSIVGHMPYLDNLLNGAA